jgi:hypothetical protein
LLKIEYFSKKYIITVEPGENKYTRHKKEGKFEVKFNEPIKNPCVK